MTRATVEITVTVEGSPEEIDPEKLTRIALSYGYSVSADRWRAIEANSTDKIHMTFVAGDARQNPVKALDDAIDLIFESQDTMDRKELIEWARKRGDQEIRT